MGGIPCIYTTWDTHHGRHTLHIHLPTILPGYTTQHASLCTTRVYTQHASLCTPGYICLPTILGSREPLLTVFLSY